jgi:hypothetical protein
MNIALFSYLIYRVTIARRCQHMIFSSDIFTWAGSAEIRKTGSIQSFRELN